MITRVKGTQDILDNTVYEFLYKKTCAYLSDYNFKEIQIPILEYAKLFEQSVGEETDIVTKEMYFVVPGQNKFGDLDVKKEVEAEKEKICLRPELTASIMRAFLNNGPFALPWKVFSIGPTFRHERPQKGRYREFRQLSIESIGVDSAFFDAYFIAMLDKFCSDVLGLDSYALTINFLACLDDRKVFKQKLYEFLSKHESELCSTCLVRKERNILRVLDCKNQVCQHIYSKAPVITDFLCESCLQDWSAIKNYLEELSVSYTINSQLVRGLDYYNKIIFEFVDNSTLGSQSTFCGGGRYSGIATKLGSKQDYQAIGCAFGIERLVLMLENMRERIRLPEQKQLIVVMSIGQEQQSLALQIVDMLHAENIQNQNYRIDIISPAKSIKNMMSQANSMAATKSILIGSNERLGHYVTVKDMNTGVENQVAQNKLVEFLRS